MCLLVFLIWFDSIDHNRFHIMVYILYLSESPAPTTVAYPKCEACIGFLIFIMCRRHHINVGSSNNRRRNLIKCIYILQRLNFFYTYIIIILRDVFIPLKLLPGFIYLWRCHEHRQYNITPFNFIFIYKITPHTHTHTYIHYTHVYNGCCAHII